MKYEITVDHFGKEIPGSANILTEITTKIVAKNDLYKLLETSFKKLKPISEGLDKVRAEFKAELQKAQDTIAAYDAEKSKIPADE